jgi:poly(3-hydroxybutyrate) depolymerase
MMKKRADMMLRLFPILLAFTTILAGAELKTASHHSMQYYLSLPNGWAAGKQWPVVVVIEDANRQFEATGTRFDAARGDMPFILATPLVVTNGGARSRQVPTYKYSDAVWNEIERTGACQFDFDGIRAVVSDIHRQYGGEEKFFLTGFEAGGHTVWAFLFLYPETLRGVAPVETNFAARCMDGDSRSTAADRAALPIKVFGGATRSTAGSLADQTHRAIDLAQQRGFRNIAETQVAGKGHEPLPAEVLAYFFSVWNQEGGSR